MAFPGDGGAPPTAALIYHTSFGVRESAHMPAALAGAAAVLDNALGTTGGAESPYIKARTGLPGEKMQKKRKKQHLLL
jgi:hypothetical protein